LEQRHQQQTEQLMQRHTQQRRQLQEHKKVKSQERELERLFRQAASLSRKSEEGSSDECAEEEQLSGSRKGK
jgi:hypothetical protein